MSKRIELKGKMLFNGKVPLSEKVVLKRITSHAFTIVETNVPWLVVSGSPYGYEWGYEGSGPSDLALNILVNVLPILGFRANQPHERLKCYHNDCSYLAWRLHQDFKRDFIAKVPYEGGEIALSAILVWLGEEKQLETIQAVKRELTHLSHFAD